MSELQWMLTIASLQAHQRRQGKGPAARGRNAPGNQAAKGGAPAAGAGAEERAVRGDALSRSLRIFLSSTFLDFGPERDLFATRVFPVLANLCSKRGVVLAYVDLRWGVTAEQTQSAQTISICLDQVSGSDVFLGFLGQRYGWHRVTGSAAGWSVAQEAKNALLARSFAAAAVRYPWIAKYADRSVTELEVRHAVLNEPRAAAVARMYFKPPPAGGAGAAPGAGTAGGAGGEGEEAAQRLRQLKAEVTERCAHVLEYHSLAELEAAMVADLRAVIDQMFPEGEVPTKWERERSVHQIFANRHAAGYVEHHGLLDRLTAAVSGSAAVALCAPAGAGKTALLASWIAQARRREAAGGPGAPAVVAHFVGSTAESTDYVKVLRRLLFELGRLFPDAVDQQLAEHTRDEDVVATFGLAFRNAAHAAAGAGRRLVLVVDGLDFLEDRDHAASLWWLRGALAGMAGVAVVVAGRTPPPGQWLALDVPPLDEPDKRALLTGHLRQFGKELTELQLQAVARVPQTRNPFFLRLLAAELCVFGSFEQLDVQLRKYLAARDVRELHALVLQRLEDDFDRLAPGLVHKLMAVLSVACIGCTEAELLGILNIPSALLCSLLSSIEGSLVNRAGAYALDAALNEAVTKRYLSTPAARLQAHSWLADFFLTQPMNKRVCRELPLHLERSNRAAELQTLLARQDVLQMLFTRDHKKFEFLRYWRSAVAGTKADPAQLYAQSLQRQQQQTTPLSRAEVAALQRLVASFLVDFGNLAAARPLLEQVVADCSFAPAARGGDKAAAVAAAAERGADMLALATVLERLGQFARAEEIATKLMALWRDSPNAEDVASATRLLALLHKKQGRYSKALALVREAIRLVEAKLGAQHVALAVYHSELGDVYRKMGDFDRALQAYRTVLRIQEHAYGSDNAEVAEARYNFAQVLKKQGKYTEAKEMVKQSIATSEALLGADHVALAPKISLLADLVRKEDDYEQAEALYRRVIALSTAALGAEHVDTAEAMQMLALVKKKQGQHGEADALFAEALRVMRLGLGDRHPKVATVMALMADNERKKSNLDTAFELYRQALEINRRALGADHPDVADNLRGLGSVYLKRGDVAEAERSFTKALQIVTKALGKAHGKAAELAMCLGDVHRKANSFHAAKEAYLQGITTATAAYGPRNAEVADGEYKLGLLFKKYHWFSEAELWLGRATEGFEAIYGRAHPKFALVQQAMGDVLRKFGNFDAAEALYLEALSTNRSVFGGQHEEVAQCLSGLGQVYHATGRHTDAEEHILTSIQMTTELLGETHRHTLNRLRNLIALLRSMGREAEALEQEELRNALLRRKEEAGAAAAAAHDLSPPQSPTTGSSGGPASPLSGGSRSHHRHNPLQPAGYRFEDAVAEIGDAAVMYL